MKNLERLAKELAELGAEGGKLMPISVPVVGSSETPETGTRERSPEKNV